MDHAANPCVARGGTHLQAAPPGGTFRPSLPRLLADAARPGDHGRLASAGGAVQAQAAMDDTRPNPSLAKHPVPSRKPNGISPVHPGADGRGAADLPVEPQVRGTRSIASGQLADSHDGPESRCTHIVYADGAVLLRSAAASGPRGQAERLVAGNPGGL